MEKNLLIIFDSDFRAADVAALVKFGLALEGAKFLCLGDYANSRGAADMGLYPDRLPGYQPFSNTTAFHQEWGGVPQAAGQTLPEMIDSAKAGKLKAIYMVGTNPVARFGIDPFALSQSFVVVQDMFLTETATIADVVLPAANAYEKSGTFTNTCGDLQIVKKAGEITGTKSDFEMIVRIADAMGADVRKLVPFGGGTRSDMGQSRGAQSGEADEIQRLVPGYGVSRLNLLAGEDQHTSLPAGVSGVAQNPELIVPANDGLFSSGTLGRYSRALNSVMENQNRPTEAEVGAD